MFDHYTVLEAQDIDHDPVRRLAEASEATVQHDEVVFSDCQLAFVTQIGRSCGDQLEQTLATRGYMGTVLNIGGRPEAFGRSQILAIGRVTLVKSL